ncbi:hypothetical protein JCGZ_24069 [Jatropha curcas]|uniref:Late embryogenesis abundant protein LEA-2 subgroup domain-containing protein n=1 Tax=Jatropha curcas TaxID=180498 RepID=A0A067LPP0_JATCU|nr:NDR1/HIN1-like protein 13 [Jatropha curcas]KDP46860.1 hypothetical protein JCGZ_24069 [Jatropha curcas]
MEERFTTITSDSTDDSTLRPRASPANYEPIFRPRPFPSRKRSIQERSKPLAIESETYVVQIPKDQIFSVPPPEHAIIAERHRNPEKEDNTGRRSCLICVLITLTVLAVLMCLILGILRILYNPKAPRFSIVQVHVENISSKQLRYEMKLKVKNKNKKMKNIYRSDGDAILLYKSYKIGTGKPPQFVQAAGSLTNIGFGISGKKNGSLAKEIEKSIGDRKGKRHVALVLKMNVPVKMKSSKKVINVVCNFKVSSLGASGRNVLSQRCQTKFK